jgi:RNA recognition motif-containing protein
LWVGLVPEQATEQDLFNVAYVYGTVVSVKISRPSASAFIEFSTRSEAENAILHLSLGVSIVGCVLPVRWAKPQRPQIGAAVNQGPYGFDMPPPPGLDYAPLLHGSVETTDGMHEQKRSRIVQPSTMVYPSMDPNRLGST